MKDNKPQSSVQAEKAMQQVLQAERDAERAIEDCEMQARQIVSDAHGRAQRINARADERITNLEMRHDHKLDQMIREIERRGDSELRQDAGQQYDENSLREVIENMAAELCRAEVSSEDEPDTGR